MATPIRRMAELISKSRGRPRKAALPSTRPSPRFHKPAHDGLNANDKTPTGQQDDVQNFDSEGMTFSALNEASADLGSTNTTKDQPKSDSKTKTEMSDASSNSSSSPADQLTITEEQALLFRQLYPNGVQITPDIIAAALFSSLQRQQAGFASNGRFRRGPQAEGAAAGERKSGDFTDPKGTRSAAQFSASPSQCSGYGRPTGASDPTTSQAKTGTSLPPSGPASKDGHKNYVRVGDKMVADDTLTGLLHEKWSKGMKEPSQPWVYLTEDERICIGNLYSNLHAHGVLHGQVRYRHIRRVPGVPMDLKADPTSCGPFRLVDFGSLRKITDPNGPEVMEEAQKVLDLFGVRIK